MHKNFIYKVKVYYEDTDAGGIVYYANYLNFLERARTEAINNIGLSNKKIKENFNAFIVVRSCNIQYKKSAYLEDELSIRSFVKDIKKTSFSMMQIITRKDEVITEALIKLVFINNFGKPTKMPHIIYENFKPYFCDSIKT